MRVILACWVVLAGCDYRPQTVADCLPTFGDQCSCTPQCMTQAEIDHVQRGSVCDLGCGDTDSLQWECTIVDDQCAVAE